MAVLRHTPRPPSPTAVIAGAVVAAALVAWGLTQIEQPPPIQIAWAPVQSTAVLEEELAPLTRYLEDELGRPVDLVVTQSYQDSADRLVLGHAPFAMLPPYAYVLTKQREPRIRALTNQLWDGAGSSQGLLVVRDEPNRATLDDLRGETFCFVDPNSTTGALLPRAYIRSQGREPEDFVGAIHWSGSHQDALKDLEQGKCATAATYDGNVETAASYGIDTEALRTLAVTGATPNEAIVAGPDVDPVLASQLQEALLRFDPRAHAGVEFVGGSQHISGFEAAQESAFDPIRAGLRHGPTTFRPW